MKVLTAAEARGITQSVIKQNNHDQMDAIMKGIDGASSLGHYHFVYEAIIESDVQAQLRALGYKLLPPFTTREGFSTQIEW